MVKRPSLSASEDDEPVQPISQKRARFTENDDEYHTVPSRKGKKTRRSATEDYEEEDEGEDEKAGEDEDEMFTRFQEENGDKIVQGLQAMRKKKGVCTTYLLLGLTD
jgi:hypothetical protein